MLRLSDFNMPLGYTDGMLHKTAAEILRTDESNIDTVTLTRRRLTNNPASLHYRVSADVCVNHVDEKVLAEYGKRRGVTLSEDLRYPIRHVSRENRPVIIGFGPAGMFAGLLLALSGVRPIILERGKSVDERTEDITRFRNGFALNPESNYLFGEGGAGAYSDGKLKAGVLDRRKYFILSELVSAGASPDIMFEEKAHIGSDVLPHVVKRVRNKIIEHGGEIKMNCRFSEFVIRDGEIHGVRYETDGTVCEIPCRDVILSIGHSARDTLESLYHAGIPMESKGFGVGVRIEHPQSLINKLRYGNEELAQSLGAGDYHAVTHLVNGRSVYSFCMCPGGEVVPSVTEVSGICTNGMSLAARTGCNANSALLVSVFPSDFSDNSPLAGIDYQRKIERAAYTLSENTYRAPVQTLRAFLSGETSFDTSLIPTYKPGVFPCEISRCFPHYITQSLRMGIRDFDEWMPGFNCDEAILTAPETRSTSPVRIVRGDNLQSPCLRGLYPCGEGAGYAGGIVSAAADGIRCAEAFLDKNQ